MSGNKEKNMQTNREDKQYTFGAYPVGRQHWQQLKRLGFWLVDTQVYKKIIICL